MGTIYLLGRKIEYKVTKKGCWIVTSHKPQDNGYIQLSFWDPVTKKLKRYYAHRLSYCEDNDINIEDLENCVLHKCDNPPCICPEHLFDGTKGDNNKDRHLKGHSKGGSNKGKLNGRSKLTDEKVLDIRAKKGIVLRKDLAKQYGVSETVISNIQNNKSWKIFDRLGELSF